MMGKTQHNHLHNGGISQNSSRNSPGVTNGSTPMAHRTANTNPSAYPNTPPPPYHSIGQKLCSKNMWNLLVVVVLVICVAAISGLSYTVRKQLLVRATDEQPFQCPRYTT